MTHQCLAPTQSKHLLHALCRRTQGCGEGREVAGAVSASGLLLQREDSARLPEHIAHHGRAQPRQPALPGGRPRGSAHAGHPGIRLGQIPAHPPQRGSFRDLGGASFPVFPEPVWDLGLKGTKPSGEVGGYPGHQGTHLEQILAQLVGSVVHTAIILGSTTWQEPQSHVVCSYMQLHP